MAELDGTMQLIKRIHADKRFPTFHPVTAYGAAIARALADGLTFGRASTIRQNTFSSHIEEVVRTYVPERLFVKSRDPDFAFRQVTDDGFPALVGYFCFPFTSLGGLQRRQTHDRLKHWTDYQLVSGQEPFAIAIYADTLVLGASSGGESARRSFRPRPATEAFHPTVLEALSLVTR